MSKKQLLLFCILYLTLSLSAYSQEQSVKNYFPLRIGNTWTYINKFDSSLYVKSIIDTIRIKDKLYYIFARIPETQYADTIRSDNSGCIWKYWKGKDQMWFDFTMDEDSTYNFDPQWVNDSVLYFVKTYRNLVSDTYAGIFENCVCLAFDVKEYRDVDKYYYFAQDVGIVTDNSGLGYWILYSAVVDGKIITNLNEEKQLPQLYSLEQNYPNPFNPKTKISFTIPAGQHVDLKVYNILGNEVATLFDNYTSAGRHEIEFNSSELSSGVYFYSIKAGNFIQTKKLTVLK